MEAKKVRERFLLDAFATVCTDFPTGTIEDTESPDFLISQGSSVIGIEVIDYVRDQDGRGSVHRRNEILLQKLAIRARQEYESLYPYPLMIHFLGHPPGQQLSKIDMPRLALDAAETVGQFAPETLFEGVRIDSDQFKGTMLQTVVASMSATRVRNARQASWSVVSAGFVSASVQEIRELVAYKDAKVPTYLQRCHEVWLLIVGDGTSISSTLDLSEDVEQVVFPSRFERANFYDHQGKQVIRLHTQR
jgi:hypothetical protein